MTVVIREVVQQGADIEVHAITTAVNAGCWGGGMIRQRVLLTCQVSDGELKTKSLRAERLHLQTERKPYSCVL